MLCARGVTILRPGLEWAGVCVCVCVCVCVGGGRRSAARGYLAMCCETVLTQDTASSCNNGAVTLPADTRCNEGFKYPESKFYRLTPAMFIR